MYPICPFIYREYLKTFMLADIFISQSVSEDNRVAMPKINQESLSKILVAIPPLAEQHRIVAKVNELNALCDELESSLTITDTTRKQLLESLLSETFAINENFHRGDRPL
jgi:type I restriction enzyme S subunit